ncbi:MAG: hypothetical protein KAV00_15130 [Phycisphaerae bacterium]|nr:hypothetical protein [Phycisphaerae bacterium]
MVCWKLRARKQSAAYSRMKAEIETPGQRMVFKGDSSAVTTLTNKVEGLTLKARLRHSSDSFDELLGNKP